MKHVADYLPTKHWLHTVCVWAVLALPLLASAQPLGLGPHPVVLFAHVHQH